MGKNCSGYGQGYKDRILTENLEELAHSVVKCVRGCLIR